MYTIPPTDRENPSNRLQGRGQVSRFSGVQETSHYMVPSLTLAEPVTEIIPAIEAGELNGQLELFEPTDITRPDVNMAKWSGWLYSSPWAKDLYERKSHSWTVERNGKNFNASITVIPAKGMKRPTITTHRVFLALVQVWEQSGKPPSGKVVFSARQLAHLMKWKWAGRKTAENIQEHLSILNSTTIDWERSFWEGDELQTLKEEMKVIDAKAYLTRERMIDQEFFRGQHTVRLNQELVDNMIAGVTKPVNYTSFFSIANETDAKLYSLLDTYLSEKTMWRRNGRALICQELEHGDAVRYRKRNIRRQFLKARQQALNGKELSNGVLYIEIEPNKDNSDDNFIARREPFPDTRRRRPNPQMNQEEDIPFIVSGLVETLQIAGYVGQDSHATLAELARWYSLEMLRSQASILKADYRDKIKTTVAETFVWLVHREVHQRGLEWFKDCGADCPERHTQSGPGLFEAKSRM